jgi:glycosyltransferase involved in cell wall biosynthesis
MTSVKVSILCNTYNHEAFIESALKGFLSQKCTFPYELIIHDDTSTDKTVSIIKTYETKFLNGFKLLTEVENQVTLGKRVMDITAPYGQGDYLAVCDGDDVWIDPLKLQKQADYLDDHPECSLVISAHVTQSANFPYLTKTVQCFKEDKTISIDEVFSELSLRFVYSSFMFRRKDLIMPDVFKTLRYTDLPRILYSTLIGNVRYISDPMTLYRTGVSTSLSMKQINDHSARIRQLDQLMDFYHQLDDYTSGSHRLLFTQQIAFCALQKAVLQGDKETFRQLNQQHKIPYLTPKIIRRMEISMNHPKLVTLYRNIRLKHWR